MQDATSICDCKQVKYDLFNLTKFLHRDLESGCNKNVCGNLVWMLDCATLYSLESLSAESIGSDYMYDLPNITAQKY